MINYHVDPLIKGTAVHQALVYAHFCQPLWFGFKNLSIRVVAKVLKNEKVRLDGIQLPITQHLPNRL